MCIKYQLITNYYFYSISILVLFICIWSRWSSLLINDFISRNWILEKAVSSSGHTWGRWSPQQFHWCMDFAGHLTIHGWLSHINWKTRIVMSSQLCFIFLMIHHQWVFTNYRLGGVIEQHRNHCWLPLYVGSLYY